MSSSPAGTAPAAPGKRSPCRGPAGARAKRAGRARRLSLPTLYPPAHAAAVAPGKVRMGGAQRPKGPATGRRRALVRNVPAAVGSPARGARPGEVTGGVCHTDRTMRSRTRRRVADTAPPAPLRWPPWSQSVPAPRAGRSAPATVQAAMPSWSPRSSAASRSRWAARRLRRAMHVTSVGTRWCRSTSWSRRSMQRCAAVPPRPRQRPGRTSPCPPPARWTGEPCRSPAICTATRPAPSASPRCRR